MKLLLKQKFFSILDSFDIYYEDETIAYQVKSKLNLTNHFQIFDKDGNLVGEVKKKLVSILPTFYMIKDGVEFGKIVKKFTFLKPKFIIDAKGYEVTGDLWEWDYNITKNGKPVGTVSKQIFNWTDTYLIDVEDDCVLDVLMIVLAIDAVKQNEEDNAAYDN